MLGHGKRALRRENEQLRQALLEQWLDAHAEHCTNEYPHSGTCHWQPPQVLGDPVRLLRLYGYGLEEPVGFDDDGA
jgi:hypothetical protein